MALNSIEFLQLVSTNPTDRVFLTTKPSYSRPRSQTNRFSKNTTQTSRASHWLVSLEAILLQWFLLPVLA